MSQEPHGRSAAYSFVLNHIDSVPQLETLLLLWASRPRAWSTEEVAKRLYISPGAARAILQELAVKSLIEPVIEPVPDTETYSYKSASEEQDLTLASLEETYRRETVPISSMIHSKASRAVLDFARAFRFTKERE
jgi:predicted ArsR family transcriptional regulator